MTKDEYLAAFYAACERDDLAEADRIAHEMLPLVINELSDDELDRFSAAWRFASISLKEDPPAARRGKTTTDPA